MSSTEQFYVDSTWNVRLEHYQMELICLSILNASFKTKSVEEVYQIWDGIKTNRLINEMQQQSEAMKNHID